MHQFENTLYITMKYINRKKLSESDCILIGFLFTSLGFMYLLRPLIGKSVSLLHVR